MENFLNTEISMHFIEKIISDDLSSGRCSELITRFPPEPNGFLHLGHAKAICLNFSLAEEYAQKGVKACCHLRFDDTNPLSANQKYVEAIKEDVRWLGFDYGKHCYFASSYLDFFLERAEHLIKKGMAYVDFQSPEEIRKNRGTLDQKGINSPHREYSVKENQDFFDQMKGGEFGSGEAVLRAKIDMLHSNLNMRDPLLYRILFCEKSQTNKIYAMYDFAHPLEDAYERVTHSLCSLEFENHRPLYDWFIENCSVEHKPKQIEFARLSLSHTVMSKRKLSQLVERKYVQGWDDPRMPTISGLRRRGVRASAIKKFCEHIGVTKFNSVTEAALLENFIRKDLEGFSPRRMVVLSPLKVKITNYTGEENFSLPDFVKGEEKREICFSNEIWIEKEDFQENPEEEYYRLSIGKTVRLRGGYCITCTGFKKNSTSGEIEEIYCEYIPDTIGKSAPKGTACKTAIQWVSVLNGVDIEVRIYESLFSQKILNDDFLSQINLDSLKIIHAKSEPLLLKVPAGHRCQFERVGYFCSDSIDHLPGKTGVFNLTVSLKNSWKRKSR